MNETAENDLCLNARDSPALSRVSMFTRVEQGAPLSYLQPVCYCQIHPWGVCHSCNAPEYTAGRDHLGVSRNTSAILTDGQGVTVPSARQILSCLTPLMQLGLHPVPHQHLLSCRVCVGSRRCNAGNSTTQRRRVAALKLRVSTCGSRS